MPLEHRLPALAHRALLSCGTAAWPDRSARDGSDALVLPQKPLLKPFCGWRPLPHEASRAVTPPFLVASEAEALTWSPRPAFVLADGGRAGRGHLRADQEPGYYVYRISRGNRASSGLIAAASISAYVSGRIRRHEGVQPAKVDLQRRQFETQRGESEPVLLISPSEPSISAFLAAATCAEPETRITMPDGTRHELWTLSDPATVTLLAYVLESLPALYIADGHHRAAAAEHFSRAREEAGQQAPDAAHRHFLAAIFPEEDVEIHELNRITLDLGGLTPAALLSRLGEHYSTRPDGSPSAPLRPGQVGLFLEGNWYRLEPKSGPSQGAAAADRLPARLLHEHILRPILGIADEGGDGRIEFIPGTGGHEAIARRIGRRGTGAGFRLPAVAMADLMAAADAGLALPPKSTWFEPKPAQGLVSYRLD